MATSTSPRRPRPGFGGGLGRIRRQLNGTLDARNGPALDLLRRWRPILVTPKVTVVTRLDDVKEVLADTEHFGVDLYPPKINATSGPFILSTDDPDRHGGDVRILRDVVRAEDLDRVRETVTSEAQEAIASALPRGRIDVVGDYAHRVLVHTVVDYLGTPGPDPVTLVRWANVIFAHIFVNVTDDADVRIEATTSPRGWADHLDRLIAERERADAERDDVLVRLLARRHDGQPSFDPVAIRQILMGLVLGWIPTVAKAVPLIIDELFARPQVMRAARAAARENDDATLADHVFEIMRLRPVNTGLLRMCVADTTIAAGTERETTIPAGTVVLVATKAAMRDPTAMPEPDEVRLDRPVEHQVLFGYGMHSCFGEPINRAQLPALIKPLLQLPGLRRAPGRGGHIRWDWQLPARFHIGFDARRDPRVVAAGAGGRAEPPASVVSDVPARR
jgi:cytochrome P450